MSTADDLATWRSAAETWLVHARSDLALVGRNTGAPGILPETLCFHAQQAAEKAVKAVLVLKGIHFPRTHDIGALVQLLPPDVPRDPCLRDGPLYPGNAEPLEDTDVDAASGIAAVILRWAEGVLGGSAQAPVQSDSAPEEPCRP